MIYVIKYFHHILRIMWWFFCPAFGLTSHKSKAVDLSFMDVSAFHGIDARGVNGRMSENIRKAHDILMDGIIGACKKVAQVVREHLALFHPRRLA